MKRGDVITVAMPGDYGKPRPAIIIQSDLFNETHASFTVLPLTSESHPSDIYRIPVAATAANGLRVDSQAMIDKIAPVHRDRIGGSIGRVTDETLLQLTRAIAVWVGIG